MTAALTSIGTVLAVIGFGAAVTHVGIRWFG